MVLQLQRRMALVSGAWTGPFEFTKACPNYRRMSASPRRQDENKKLGKLLSPHASESDVPRWEVFASCNSIKGWSVRVNSNRGICGRLPCSHGSGLRIAAMGITSTRGSVTHSPCSLVHSSSSPRSNEKRQASGRIRVLCATCLGLSRLGLRAAEVEPGRSHTDT
jgi:hypothetical protein